MFAFLQIHKKNTTHHQKNTHTTQKILTHKHIHTSQTLPKHKKKYAVEDRGFEPMTVMCGRYDRALYRMRSDRSTPELIPRMRTDDLALIWARLRSVDVI